MVKEIWDSLKHSINNRIRNPFLGTLSIVYLLHNWQFFYLLLTFDKDISYDKRIETLKPLIENSIKLENILYVILITFIVLLFSYSCLSLSQLIILIFQKKINPRIDKLTDDKSIITKKIYDQAIKELKELREKYEDEYNQIIQLRNERNQLQEQLLLVKKENDSINEPMKKELTKKKDFSVPKSEENKIFPKLFNKIITSNWYDGFEEIINNVRNLKRINTNSPLVKELVNFEIVKLNTKYGVKDDFVIYDFTDIGNQFVQYYVLNR